MKTKFECSRCGLLKTAHLELNRFGKGKNVILCDSCCSRILVMLIMNRRTSVDGIIKLINEERINTFREREMERMTTHYLPPPLLQ